MSKPIAIIPARAGSKRIPKKNIVEFNGKPLIGWTINSALTSGCFESVYVSTDSEEIAEVSRSFGAEVPFMRNTYADDSSTVSQSSAWFVEKLQNERKIQNKSVVQLMANCPIRSVNTLQEFMHYALSCDLNSSVISVVEPKFGSPFWAMKKIESNVPDDKGAFIFSDFMQQRSQDLPKCFYPTGSIWFSSIENLVHEKNFYSNDFRIKAIPWLEGIDIDTPEELSIAQVLHQAFIEAILS